MVTRFVPNEPGIRAMLAGPQMVAALDRTGQRIVNAAHLIGPYRTGDYYRSWRVYSGVRNGVAWCRVANVIFYAYYLEWGTKYMRRQRVLGKAVQLARRR
jgi:hypothetical protein